jgi:anti-sigma-K factor RskA
MRSAAGAESRVAVISAPDVLQVSLAGQPPAPGAVGRAFWSRSRGLVFAAASLPPLPADRTYQLWYLTSGAPVSAGLFRPDASGRAVVTVDPPPGGVAPTGLAVSNEPAAGVPAPTGPIYLAGMTH